MTARMAGCIRERRDERYVSQPLGHLLRQRVYQILAGYEDQNDADYLRRDPIPKTCCDRAPETGHDLGSQPTLSQRNGKAIDSDRVVEFLSGRGDDSGLKDRIADLEQGEIERVMKVCEGNKTRAAKMLGISRKTLWQKLKDLDS